MGFPIRKCPDQSLFAAPRSLSQRTTSFIASQRQGIHHMPFRHLIALIIDTHASAECVPPRDFSCGRIKASMQSFRKDQLASQIQIPGMWVSLGRAYARTKNYTTSVFDFPCGKADGCPGDLPLHDVKDFAVAVFTADGNGILHQTDIRFVSFVMIASLPSFGKWWSQTGSNRRPPACKAGALPTELWPRSKRPGRRELARQG